MTDRLSAAEYRCLAAQPQRRNKFNAQPVEVDGIRFDSKREAAAYVELRMRERAGEIHSLELQRAFPLIVNGEQIGTYRADFAFWDIVADRFRVQDVKGVQTREFRRTRKLIQAIYGVDVEVVK